MRLYVEKVETPEGKFYQSLYKDKNGDLCRFATPTREAHDARYLSKLETFIREYHADNVKECVSPVTDLFIDL
jgi:hypothetical protein